MFYLDFQVLNFYTNWPNTGHMIWELIWQILNNIKPMQFIGEYKIQTEVLLFTYYGGKYIKNLLKWNIVFPPEVALKSRTSKRTDTSEAHGKLPDTYLKIYFL